MSKPIQFSALSSSSVTLLKSACKRSKNVAFNTTNLVVENFEFDVSQWLEYSKLFKISRETVISPFLFVASQTAQLTLLLEPTNKLTILGLIHRSISFYQTKDLALNTKYKLELAIENHVSNEMGDEFDIVGKLSEADELVCEYTSRYLIRKQVENQTKKIKLEIAQVDPNDLGSDLIISVQNARTYAKVSKDYNPIHLHSVLSSFFGYKRPIIHGMYMVGQLYPKNSKHKSRYHFEFSRPALLPITLIHYNYDNCISLLNDKHKPVITLSTR